MIETGRAAPDDANLTEAEMVMREEEREAQGETEDDGEAKKNRLPEIPVAEIAVVASPEDLQRVLADHKAWMAAVLDPKVEVARGRANLQGVDLTGFDLEGANLSATNLAGANLEQVNLQGANLSAANLTGTRLACANLAGAKLRGAKIDGADLRGADLTGALLGTLDLSRAILKSDDAAVAADAAVDAAALDSLEPSATL
jgi:uncharacterized protein YjbI with pentapeptide repeats